MTRENPKDILDKYLNDTATPEERRWIEAHYVYLLKHKGDHPDKKQIDRASRALEDSVQLRTGVDLHGARSGRRVPNWYRYAAAILVFLMVGGSLYWYYIQGQRSSATMELSQAEDILPGGNRATLTLSDGRSINLSTHHSEIIIGDDLRYADGSAVLDPAEDGTAIEPVTLLTLATPKGGTYRLVLPDSSQVWLNAASVLTYPSGFTGRQRIVELSGEAYFSVTADADRPFRVISKGQEVEVLGTEFNITAYDDEPSVRSTLVEGSVRISSLDPKTAPAVLHPGQQAVLQNGSLDVHQIEVANIISWKDGRFSFENKSFQQVMRELARWYDIEVIYEGPVPQVEFYGGVFRNHRLSTVLSLLESAGLQYRIRDRTLIVSDHSINRKGGSL